MTRILVATDGSDGANRAIDYAAAAAKARDAELVIVNVGGDGLPQQVFRSFTHAQHAWLEETLSAVSADVLVKARTRALEAGVSTVQIESRMGDAAPTILEIARERGADAIVVGKRGAGRVAGLLIGSVSQKLVSLADVPVTVVP